MARLNADGTVDNTFDPGANAPNATVNAVALTASGRIVLGGNFTQLGAQSFRHLAQLNGNGSIDNSFTPQDAGTDGPVFALAAQPDGRLLVGGEFTITNGLHFPIVRLARLLANGVVDTNYFSGGGPDDTVFSLNLQADGTIYVGGLFRAINGTHRAGFARLYPDGSVDTTFLDPAYNQFAGLPRSFFGEAPGAVFASAVQSDGNVMIGGRFTSVGGGQYDANSWTAAFFEFGGAVDFNSLSEPKARDGVRSRNNIARLIGGATPGPGNIGLLNGAYSVNASQTSLFVSLLRQHGTLGPASANFSVKPGLAQPGEDYFYNSAPPIYWNTWNSFPLVSRMHSDGLFGTNTFLSDLFGNFWWNWPDTLSAGVTVSVTPNQNVRGNLSADFLLDSPVGADQFYLGGQNIPLGVAIGRSGAAFSVVDDLKQYGTFGFTATNYTGIGLTPVSVGRTGGSFGAVQVSYATSDGTAVSGVDYSAASGTLVFATGQTNRSFNVQVLQNSYISAVEKTVNLRLFGLNFTNNGPALGQTNAVLRIINPNFQGYLNFSATNYAANLSAGILPVSVTRTVGSKGTLTVQCITTNGSALNGQDYTGSTNNLTWNDGDVSPRIINIPLLDNGLVGGTRQFAAKLLNPKLNSTNQPALLGSATSATLTITNDNSSGKFAFSASTYEVNESGGVATITVVRSGGSSQPVSVNFATSDAFALNGINYTGTNGTLAFASGELARSFDVRILNDGVSDPPPDSFYFAVNLTSSTPAGLLGYQTNALVKIKDAQTFNEPPGSEDVAFDPNAGMNNDVLTLGLQSDGGIIAGGSFTTANSAPRNRVARLGASGALDGSFLNGLAGANNTVNALCVQGDDRIVLGGAFTFVNSVHRNFICRLGTDGSMDTSFNPGSGVDAPVNSVAETYMSDGARRIYLGGNFGNFNGTPRSKVARLNENGTLDGTFNVTGVDGAIYSVLPYPTNSVFAGKVLIAGDFLHVNGVASARIARLNLNGTLDASFSPGTGADGIVRALAIQLDGRVLLAGAFTNVNGAGLNHIARLNSNGSVDASFTAGVGVGANDTVDAIALQADNRIMLGGLFTQANGVTRSRVTRLMPSGAVDPTINFGTGANSFVAALAVQTNGAIVLGGGFTAYNDVPHAHLVRIYGGSMAGSGSFRFTTGNYYADEISSNAVVTVRRVGGTSGSNADGSGSITVDFATSANTAVNGVNYNDVTTTLVFPVGEVERTVTIPVFDDQVVTPNLTVDMALSNPQAPAGLGGQPVAVLNIINDDSTISLSSSVYSVNKNVALGYTLIDILRQGSTNGAVTVDFMTTTNGTASNGTDYLAVSNRVVFNPGASIVQVQIPILNNPLPTGDRTVGLLLTNALSVVSNSVNLLLLPPVAAILTINDTVQAPGQVRFGVTNIVAVEANSNLVVTVLRTNGSYGTISVNYTTVVGTATPGVNYTTTAGTLTFGNGETVKTFVVPLLENNVVQGPVTLSLMLSNATGGASLLAPFNVPVTILDNDTGLAFSSAAYVVNELTGSVTLNVVRLNTTNGVVQVSYATTNGTALAGTNYTTTTGTLTFNPGETNKSIIVPILHDLRATSNLTFAVNLFNPTGGAQLAFPSTTSVIVVDAEAALGFTNATFSVLKSGTNAILTVFCSNPNAEPISVNYASADGTALAGTDYTAVSGTLSFTNGAVTNYILVPIINNSLIQGDRDFTVTLSGPTVPGQLVSPSVATVTIKDANAGLSFSSPTYSVFKNGVAATIGVVRSGVTNSTVTVDYATLDGTGTNGVDYTAVSGTLVFTNGQTSLSFNVPVTDSTTVKPDKTVLLQLSNPVGTNGVLATPSAALLTIRDNSGSLVVAAGAALVSESGPVNGVIDPGENVSVLFALRNGGGTNTANLTATLVATNGISSPSAAQNYGALLVNGPSASRQFSFTANGSNGAPIVATFLLTNGTVSAGTVSFTFTLGNSALAFTNAGAIIIPAQGAASPYASVINVSGVAGSLTKATVTFNQLTHTAASDIDALLVSPTGQKMLLLANAGNPNGVNGVTLTFDDAATGYLPQNGQIVSGTNRPSPYFPVTVFPAPAPAAPYNTNLATFNGSNPNGTWSLYILDDAAVNSGMISNGWSLNLTAVNLVGSTADLVATASTAGSVIVGNNLTYNLTVTNYGPSTATGVILTNALPAGVTYISSSATQGGISVAAGVITWTPGTLVMNAGAALSFVVNTTSVGTLTNNCYVQGNETDPNTVNNAATTTTPVVGATADLVLSLVDAPDPLYSGNNVTYTITVTNAGPATAPGVSITNTLPPTVTFVSATPAGYVRAGQVLTFTNLGSLAVGGQTVASIVVRTTVGGTITNTAVTASLVTDPFKANNSATVKTVVDLLQLGVVRSGGNLVITWPTNTPGYVLESAASLNPPVVWTTVTSPTPVISNGQYVLTIGIGTGSKYYRLHGP